jgi:hypothetical protein
MNLNLASIDWYFIYLFGESHSGGGASLVLGGHGTLALEIFLLVLYALSLLERTLIYIPPPPHDHV